MTWVKMDDRFPDHPKVAGLTDGAYRLWTTGIAYCSRHLTDGLIAEQVITRWGVKHPDRAASELVSGGLWRSNADGYEVVNYMEYQRSKDEIEALSAKRAAAGRAGAQAKAKGKQPAGQLPASGQDVAPTVRPPESEADSDPENSSSSVTAGLPDLSPDDDEVLTILATHRLDSRKASDVVARKGPVGNDSLWCDRAKRRDSFDGGLLMKLRGARTTHPTATAAQLARFIFDNTAPPKPPKQFTHDCGEVLDGPDAFADHLEACEPAAADLVVDG